MASFELNTERLIGVIYGSIQAAQALFVSIVGAVHVRRCIESEKQRIAQQKTIKLQVDSKPEQEDDTKESSAKEDDTTEQDEDGDAGDDDADDVDDDAPGFCKLWLQTVWKMRGVYGGLAVHCFDVLTDILVIVQWTQIAKLPNSEHLNIDPVIMAWSGISVLIASRVISAAAIFNKERSFRRAFMQLLDLIVFEEIFESHKKIVSQIKNRQSIEEKHTAIESTLSFKYARQFEAVFESIPQSVLQLVYVMRTSEVNWIFAVSIAQSAISMTNSIVENDYTQMHDDRFKKYKQRAPPTLAALKHTLSRFCEVVYRMGLLALLWSVCGGLLFSIVLAVDALLIVIKTATGVYTGDYELNADTILLSANQLIVLPSEEVYHVISGLDTPWYMYAPWYMYTDRDATIMTLNGILMNFFCCGCVAAALSAVSKMVMDGDGEVTVYPIPTQRMGVSLTEFFFLFFYGVFAEDGSRRPFLFNANNGLAVLIITCVSFLVYSQYLWLFPDFQLPGNVAVRSKWGYAYAGELSELQKVKVGIPKQIHIGEDAEGTAIYRRATDADIRQLTAAFWDEGFRGYVTPSMFALANGHQDVVQWLEAQGAREHIERGIGVATARKYMSKLGKVNKSLGLDSKWGLAYAGKLERLRKMDSTRSMETVVWERRIYHVYSLENLNSDYVDQLPAQLKAKMRYKYDKDAGYGTRKKGEVFYEFRVSQIHFEAFAKRRVVTASDSAEMRRAAFWDETHDGTAEGVSAAIFAMASGHYSIVKWLEDQGATTHWDRGVTTAEQAKEVIREFFCFFMERL